MKRPARRDRRRIVYPLALRAWAALSRLWTGLLAPPHGACCDYRWYKAELPRKQDVTRCRKVSGLLAAVALFVLLGCFRPRFFLPQASGAADRVLVIAPQNAAVYVGDSVRYGAMFVVEGGSVSCGPVQWLSSEEHVARISKDGVLVGRKPGTTSVVALCEGLQVSTPAFVWARKNRGKDSQR